MKQLLIECFIYLAFVVCAMIGGTIASLFWVKP
jgi:hypothetical protein